MIHTETIHREDGTVEHVDERTVEACRSFVIDRLRAACTASILAAAPEHRQRNAALGLLPREELDAITDAIQTRRAAFARLLAEIIAVDWDGTEAARAAVCDRILSVRWPDDL